MKATNTLAALVVALTAGCSTVPDPCVRTDILHKTVRDVPENLLARRKFYRQSESISTETLFSLYPTSTKYPIWAKSLHHWATLVEFGADDLTLRQIGEGDVGEIAEGFQNGTLQLEFLDKITYISDLAGLSRQAARSSKYYDELFGHLKTDLIERLNSREHLYKENSGFTEHPDQVRRIKSRDMLCLINLLLDYFDSPQAQEDINDLFSHKGYSPEEGGILCWDEGLHFIRIPNNASDTGWDEFENYDVPPINKYIPTIGFLHTHPKSKDMPCTECSAPSGTPYWIDSDVSYEGDLGILRAMTHLNPLFIDTAVIEIDPGIYNIDIYFIDFVSMEERVRSDINATILDCGIYDFNQPRKTSSLVTE